MEESDSRGMVSASPHVECVYVPTHASRARHRKRHAIGLFLSRALALNATAGQIRSPSFTGREIKLNKKGALLLPSVELYFM